MAQKKEKAPTPSSKPAKSAGGKKKKKKKWSQGKQKKKANNMVLFYQASYDKLISEAPKYKLITPSVLSDRLRADLGVKTRTQLMEEKSVFTILLTTIIDSTAVPDLQDPKNDFILNICHHFAMIFHVDCSTTNLVVNVQLGSTLSSRSSVTSRLRNSVSSNLSELDPLIFLDVLVDVLADENRHHTNAALTTLNVFAETLLFLSREKHDGFWHTFSGGGVSALVHDLNQFQITSQVCLWQFSSCMQHIWNANCASPGSGASSMAAAAAQQNQTATQAGTPASQAHSTQIVAAVAPTSGQDQIKVTRGICICSLHNLQGTLPFKSICSLYLIDGYQSIGLHLARGFENVISFYYITGALMFFALLGLSGCFITCYDRKSVQ